MVNRPLPSIESSDFSATLHIGCLAILLDHRFRRLAYVCRLDGKGNGVVAATNKHMKILSCRLALYEQNAQPQHGGSKPGLHDGAVMVCVINEVNDRPVGNPKSKV
jgi:hypothetical protein